MAKPDTRDPMVKAMEAIVERMGGDHPATVKMRGEVHRLRQAAEALDRVRANRSPLDTEAAHAMKVAKMARKLGEENTAALNRATKTWADAYADTQRRIEDKINLRPDAFAQEIRTAFRAMNGTARIKEIARLIDENRGPELAAIVKAPPSLTGLSKEQLANFEKAIVSKHAEAEMQEIDHIAEIYDAVSVATRAASRLVREMTDPGKLAAIEASAAAANEAGEGFNQSLQQ